MMGGADFLGGVLVGVVAVEALQKGFKAKKRKAKARKKGRR